MLTEISTAKVKVNKIHGLRPYNYNIHSTLQPDKMKTTSHTEGCNAPNGLI